MIRLTVRILIVTLFSLVYGYGQSGTIVRYENNYGVQICEYNGIVNGKHSYVNTSSGIDIVWSANDNRWEVSYPEFFGKVLLFSNSDDTHNPPSTDYFVWVDEQPEPYGDEITLISITGSGTSTVLPIDLIKFEANLHGDDVFLHWQTASEINNSHFEIERSKDGQHFKKIKEVYGHGTTNQVQKYETIDDKTYSGINYYRIKQVDYNGQYEYSEVISVMVKKERIGVYPNPTSNMLYLDDFSNYSIVNSKGQRVVNGRGNRVDLSNLPNGIYIVRLGDGTMEQFLKM